MENHETGIQNVDANGTEFRVGSFCRLSENGREIIKTLNPDLISKFPNIRLKIIDIEPNSSKILGEITEFTTPLKIVLNYQMIVVENF